MDFHPFTMPYLESLSTGELVELAIRNGLDIPPGLERVFIIGELFELGRVGARPRDWENGGGHGMDAVAPSDEFGELAVLPDQYGASFVDVLIRDPLWVFAFWEAKKQVRDSQGAGTEERFLRIVPLRGEGMQADTAASFTVAVGADDRSLYLGIPHDEGRCFRVDLCVRQGEVCSVVAASRPFRLPRLIEPPSDAPRGDGDVQAAYRNPLSGLSGAGRFPLVRSVDRLHRCKGA